MSARFLKNILERVGGWVNGFTRTRQQSASTILPIKVLIPTNERKEYIAGGSLEIRTSEPDGSFPRSITTFNVDQNLFLNRCKNIPVDSSIKSSQPFIKYLWNRTNTLWRFKSVITIDNISATVFEHYLRLLHTGEIPLAPDSRYPSHLDRLKQIQDAYLTLASLYELCDRLGDWESKMLVIHATVDALNDFAIDGEHMLPHWDSVNAVYANTQPGDVMRRLYIEAFLRWRTYAHVGTMRTTAIFTGDKDQIVRFFAFLKEVDKRYREALNGGEFSGLARLDPAVFTGPAVASECRL